VLTGDVTEMLLLDVTPLSLGIETLGGVMTVLIPRNTTIPTSKKEVFSTAADNQTAVDVMVFQGERQMAKDNKLLGNFRLDGLPPAPRGRPQIEVQFDLDANGILSVAATDKATGKKQHITIEASSGLTEADIKRMVDEAKDNEAADKAMRELIQERNELDSLVYQVESTLAEHGAKVSEPDRKEIQAALDAGREAKDSDDIGKVKGARERLSKASHKMAEAMYAQGGDAAGAGGAAGGGGAGGSGKADDDVIDAEFTEP
jgi:molecular chaperone DnaK